MSIVNETGIERAKIVNKEIYKTIFIAPLYATFMLALIYFGTSKNMIAFYSVGSFFIILFLILMVYAPYLMLKRHTHTICSINFENNNYVSFSTFPAVWIKEKKYNIIISELKIKKSIFNWYGKNTKRDGLIILIKGNEFYFVKDFFNDYETISEILLNSSSNAYTKGLYDDFSPLSK